MGLLRVAGGGGKPNARHPGAGSVRLDGQRRRGRGKVRIEDSLSKYVAEPVLQAEGKEGNGVMQLAVPSRLLVSDGEGSTALTPGVGFFGIRTRHEQPCDPELEIFLRCAYPPL